MSERERLSPEMRKTEILTAAMKVFREKGFGSSTMEDVIKATSLSKGGVYHYFKNTSELLYHLMRRGISYRSSVMRLAVSELENGNEAHFVAERMAEKIIDDNPYMDIYVEFLLAKKNDGKLEELFKILQEEAREDFAKILGREKIYFAVDSYYEFITHFTNSLIIGCCVLGAREVFSKNREILVHLLCTLIEKISQEGKE